MHVRPTEKFANPSQFLLASDRRSELGGQVIRTVIEASNWWEIGSNPWNNELKYMFRSLQVPEAVFAQITESDAFGDSIAGECFCCGRKKDLTAMGRAPDPSAAVYIQPRIVVFKAKRFPGVQCHSH